MKSILLIGLGRFGTMAARKLDELGHQVLAVDRNEVCVNAVMEFVEDGMIGDCTDVMFLKSLGIGNFDVCIVAIGDGFQDSLVTTALLKDEGAKFVVSRASNEIHAKFLLRNGADQIVFPEQEMAEWTAIRYTADHISDYIPVNGEYAIFEVSVSEAWIGHSVGELEIRPRHQITILSRKVDGHRDMEINSYTVLHENETLMVLGKLTDIEKCFHLL